MKSIEQKNQAENELGLKPEYEDLAEGASRLREALAAWEKNHTDQRALVLIAGPTAAGKDTLIKALNLDDQNTTHLGLDRYYLGTEDQQELYGQVNFSLPAALDQKRIEADIEKMLQAKEGEKVRVPVYSMQKSKRTGEEEIEVKKRVIVNGVYTFDQVKAETPFKIYVQAKPEELLARKIARDTTQRGVPEEVVKQRWDQNVLPAIKEHVEPQKKQATVIINNHDQKQV
jgi:uridine kinase